MRRLVLGLLLAAVVVDIVYWSVWFTDRSLIASENNEAFCEFENAFALADVWLGLGLRARLGGTRETLAHCPVLAVALRPGRRWGWFAVTGACLPDG